MILLGVVTALLVSALTAEEDSELEKTSEVVAAATEVLDTSAEVITGVGVTEEDVVML